MMNAVRCFAAIAGCAVSLLPHFATAQTPGPIPSSLVTPDKIESRIGALEFKDGVPSKATADKLFDNLDFTYAYRAFMDNMRGVSIHALREGLRSVGVKENEVIVFSDLMDAKSLFLTANADTIYVMGYLDLSKGPVVVETPPKFLGTVQDAWFRWIIDLGLPGPDRGEGGKYLIVPPDYKGQLPDGGYFIGHARTNTILWFGRSFLEDHKDPKPVAETIRKFTKVYPYEPGGVGTPISDFLAGKAKLGRVTAPPATVFHEGSGKVMNTLPPNDWTFYDMLNEVVQKEPATSLDAELMGPVAAIGIVKGKPFAPDARMKKIMTDALALANATSRALFMVPRDPSWFYYPNSSWFNFLFVSGYEFETPIPEITREGVKPFPATGYRTMDARTNFFYGVTGITPAMAMRLPGIGSQYLLAMTDAERNYFDGAKTYKVTLPKGIPEENFWSFTVYDNMTRSMLDTPQRYPRAGSQSYPSPAAEADADGSTTIYFGPTQPAGVKRGNWIQTDPKKGWFVILRLYSPLEPFFTKSWRLSEVEQVK
ncbi:DUF1254 domain-containing protein [Bradyrhizobium ottawaense]|uniref:DUF1254 domain-containing protein n=7 Tax=Nitrobacteraceae TaxID=41294 RepID=A0ABV4FK43_9BRAD|nr:MULTISPECIES: DUF1254 domain-containing protein [Bradyrhizobium]MDA9486390.1 hypothetical protein [Bradyrhizobium sp. CCBAU 11445]WLB44707.1 DUF1254 domain-containing protein [Bradyrhizobium ottawaense]WQN82004.1 DUF1254 domain-containing protein [Bradyrhizobium ottawaense]BBO03378.1 hypothetical protein SG09_27280 [Bradyrhizobium ottawaense]GMO10604.1 DUF1254 domain-containing protein [Bradyrhizobium ottawaense]